MPFFSPVSAPRIPERLHPPAHRLTLQLGERRMTLVDLPGIGETPQHDQEYRALYRQLLPELDLIIWILRVMNVRMLPILPCISFTE